MLANTQFGRTLTMVSDFDPAVLFDREVLLGATLGAR